MRLLNCRTLKLEEFIGDHVPPYAILSHRWEDDEVNFREITGGDEEYKQKRGWKKIRHCCEQALRDGHAYAWVDTICIDKSSSTELTEAINSMFRWYNNCSVCYAYLCDLPDVDLERSRWFTRGWTLQEMIAPRDLRFYDKNWGFQGSKHDLFDKLWEITGVDTAALRGGNLRFFSVARKMSWAANRETTREEDIAYCLLGIFGISMPLLYGEGKNAFTRFQEELIKTYDDETLFAWRSTEVGHTSGLLAPSPTAFAHSANIVPALTFAAEKSINMPITITSRGLLLEAPLEEFDPYSPARLIRLNCKEIKFERENGVRVGIYVTPLANIPGYPSVACVYGRTQPDKLNSWIPDETLPLQNVFALKENHFSDLELAEYDVFLIRNMPRWPKGNSFRLTSALPLEAWDKSNETFRCLKHDNHEHPFVLVFQKDSASNGLHDYFIVTLGRDIDPIRIKERYRPGHTWVGHTWCDAVFRQVENIDQLNVKAEIALLKREEKTVEAQGSGVVLKVHVRAEIISGQMLHCVDIFAKAVGT